jgi:hypothetical protein
MREETLTLEERIEIAVASTKFDPLEAISYDEEQLMCLLDLYDVPRKRKNDGHTN